MDKKSLGLKEFLAIDERTFRSIDVKNGTVTVASLSAAEMFLFWDFLALCKGADAEAKQRGRLRSAMFVAMSLVTENGERYYATAGNKEAQLAAALELAEKLVVAKGLDALAKLTGECEKINDVLAVPTPLADAKNGSGGATTGASPIASPSSSVM